ncbi:MAG: MBL fold metallo-hydrolase [Clostridia bacterium]|nr:MBL fold metallo-hydrolase [Clostridia bacterium]
MEKKQKKEYIQIVILSVFILIFAISMIFSSSISKGIKNLLFKADVKASKYDLIVHFINVGQGDAIALTLPNDKVMLIDSGPKSSQNYLVSYIKDSVLSSNNELVIDYLILTHSDIDHSGGMCAIFSEFDVKNFFRPNIASESEQSSDFALKSTLDEYNETIIKAQQEKDLQINVINQEYEFYIDKVLVQIFAPLKIYGTTNEMSPIIKVSYLGKSFLFTGDINSECENDMIKKYGAELDADVLKVAHHGSSTSTSVEFIKAVTPNYAVICVGTNSYGHPNASVVSNLMEAGSQVLTTKQTNVRIACGREFFGVLDKEVTQSYEFVDWWIIALVVELVFIFNLTKSIITLVTINKVEDEI